MANLPGKAWMDEDGRHVWYEHQCVDAVRRDMLPWSAWKNVGGSVSPSIVCTVPGCNFHSSPLITEPPSDWKPRLTREEVESGR